MARHRQADTRYLEFHRGKWRVTLATPRPLHAALGTRLKRPLNTTSLATANALKWAVVAELRAIIERTAVGNPEADQPADEALAIAAHRAKIMDPEEREALDEEIARRADEMRGDPVETVADERGGPLYLYDRDREARASTFADLAMGRATPLSHHHDTYLSHSQTKVRTQGDSKRAIAFLTEWCGRVGLPATLEAIDRKAALRFHDALPTLPAAPPSPVTLTKYTGRLNRYWAWLMHRELVGANPWTGIKFAAPKTPHDELERPFTDVEVRSLLQGPASPAMHDLMRIAALTGARLEAIVDLKAKDCADGVFVFKPQKKERGARAVPIHSHLTSIIARRLKSPDVQRTGDLFPEYPPPKASTSHRERSFRASNEFTLYRRSVGVEERVEGKRRSLVNFHSWRRFFVTKAEQAGQPEHLIAVTVGHKRAGITLGRYSAGPLLEQVRAVVESVRLPL
jgi:site-specific recombinase XerC